MRDKGQILSRHLYYNKDKYESYIKTRLRYSG